MKNLKKTMALLAGGVMLAATAGMVSADEAYPSKDIQGSVMWSAGGVCDLTSRAIGAAAQDILGQTIVFTNRPGAGGGVSTAYVDAQAADGYELLFGAENPQIAKVMGTSEIDYDNFIPVDLFCTSYASVCVAADSPYETIEDLVNDVIENPDSVIMATTGPGGLPETVATMFNDVLGTEPIMIPFDGENECMTQVMGGNADYSIVTLGSSAGFYASGDIRILAMVTDAEVPGYEDVPYIAGCFEGFDKYLPWGPFYGVFVKEGTDQAIVDTLTAAFTEAEKDQAFLDLLAAKGCFPLGLTGEEAVDYLKSYRATTSWLLYNAGAAVNSPEDFGIEQP